MTKPQKIKNRIEYWIKLLKLKGNFIYKEDMGKGFSAWTETHEKNYVIGFNSNVITLKKISNHIDRVILHEIGHIKNGHSEYKAEKYMLNILYKHNIRLYKKLVKFMKNFLSEETGDLYAFQYPKHYKEFCKVYNIERIIL